MALQHRDEGQECIAAGLTLEEIVRHGVRGGDDDHAAGEERLEEPPEQERIGDVVDLELIEAEQHALAHDRVREQRIGSPPGARCSLACMSCMKRSKCTRRLRASGAVAKKRSVSMDFPRPTSPAI